MSRGSGATPEAVRAAFGATVELTGQEADESGFFLVTPAATHRDAEGRPAFERALLNGIGGRQAVFLAEGNIYIVYATFGAAEVLRARPEVGLVGGVSVDVDHLRTALGM